MPGKNKDKADDVDSVAASLDAISINESIAAAVVSPPTISQENLERRKAAWIKFRRDRDDSSSEDEEKDNKYNWRNKISRRASLVAQETNSASFTYAYIAHEFGKLALNSTEVRDRYNELKNEHLINIRDVLKKGFRDVFLQSPLANKEEAIIGHIKKQTESYTHLRSFYKTLSQIRQEQYFISKNGEITNPQLQERLNASRIALGSCLREGIEANGETIDEISLNSWINRVEKLRNLRTTMTLSTEIIADEINGVGLLSRARLYNKNSTRAAKNGRAVDASATSIDFIGAQSNSYTKDLPGSTTNLGIFERKVATTGVKEIEWINSGKTRSSSVHFEYNTKKYGELFGHIHQEDIENIREILSGSRTFTEIYESLPVTRKTAFTETMYLLFVTEVMKNPACVVIHPMMLELVAAGEIHKASLAPLYADRKMPASLAGAIGASRGVDIRLYSKYTESPWSYDRTTSISDSTVKSLTANETKNLVEKESNIIKSWLEFKEPGISTADSLDMKAVSKHVSALCKRWYGFELDKNIALPVPPRDSLDMGNQGVGI